MSEKILESETKNLNKHVTKNLNMKDIIYKDISEEINESEIIDIILPTLDEELNILILLHELSCKRYHKIIVDDSQNDKTINNALKFIEKNKIKNITIIKGNNNKLGGAYKKGSEYLIGSKVILMDTDLSHDPEDIRKFIFIFESTNADIVTGTRYGSFKVDLNSQKINNLDLCQCCIKKDEISLHDLREKNKIFGGADWSFKRKVLSAGANTLSKLFIGKEFDYTGSFRLYDRNLFEEILKNVNSNCFSFQMEALCYAIKKKANIFQCPIIFHDRKYGESKISPIHILKFVRSLIFISLK